MNTAEELFDELLQYHHAQWTPKQRYSRLYNLLDRVCKDCTRDFAAEYTSLFARLYALCIQKQYAHRTPIELFRIHAQRARRGDFIPDNDSYLYDLKALCDFISFLYQEPQPAAIRKMLPDGWRGYPNSQRHGIFLKKVRFVVHSWQDNLIFGQADDYPSEQQQEVDCSIGTGFYDNLPTQLYSGAQLNLLEVSIQADEKVVYYPRIIVLEPDYLIDISTLTACVTEYGSTPYNYLVQKLNANETNRHKLLGNAANQFLDDLVNESSVNPANWRDSVTRNFRDYLLDYSVCPDINDSYFKDTQQQFTNIRTVIADKFQDASIDISTNEALLEPSFFCEALGLQGRMDLMLNDFSRIIELKSGKCEEFNGPHRGKNTHNLQMALYKEILYYNMNQPRDRVHTFLFYSRYPHLFEQRSSLQQIQKIIALRNAIVSQERQLRSGGGLSLLQSLTPDILNVNHSTGKLWTMYQEPSLQQFLQVFHTCSSLEGAYFNRFLQFTQREQFLSKIGDDQPDSGRGFAETWNADLATKLTNGNILVDLRIERFDGMQGIERIVLQLPDYGEAFLPNFREGDMVILYERNTDDDMATNHLVHRCTIESITWSSLTLKLNYRQRNPIIFHPRSLYAVEHDHMDSTHSSAYRGLYAFLHAPRHRKDLILSQRPPETDFSITLNGRYINQVINTLVLQAKQAKDYFLLVGPPGTGKTSVALKSMVQEFYSQPGCQILLLSYTNRAVDEICKMLEDIVPQPPYMRIGTELNCDPAFRSHLMKNLAKNCTNRQQIVQLFHHLRIIVGTVASISSQLGSLSHLKHFDVAIIDEASQILEPHLLGILSATDKQGKCTVDKFIMVGDHKQLPAVVVQRPEHSAVSEPQLQQIGLTDCRNSLFERLYRWQLSHPTPNITATLLRQGRMHPEVGQFANTHFYHGELLPVPVKHQKEPLDFARHGTDFQEYVATHRVGFLHCDYPAIEDSNKSNRGEARMVAALVGTIHALCQLNHLPFQAAERIGIIVPFRGQIAMIRKELNSLHLEDTQDIVIDTVERFQGSQRDIIIFSTTISQPYQLNILSAPVEIEGLLVDRKLNVALTRAKKQLFVVGNASLLSRHPLYKALIEEFS